jgi:hypothetical protein
MSKNFSFPEPPPLKNGQVPVWSMVIKDMCDRHASGVAKYGTPLQANNGRDPLIDAYQEALDLCVYLRQEVEQRALLRADLAAVRAREQWTVCEDDSDPPLVPESLGHLCGRSPERGNV